jgi:hypothetical protein
MVWTLVRECGADPANADRARENKLAFALALHARLGRDSPFSQLGEELLEMVLSHPSLGRDVPELGNRLPILPGQHTNAVHVALAHGHHPTADLLQWLERLQDLAPLYKRANASARNAFACPRCARSGISVAYVPCGHRLCTHCHGDRLRDAEDELLCFSCGETVLRAVPPELYPDEHPLL